MTPVIYSTKRRRAYPVRPAIESFEPRWARLRSQRTTLLLVALVVALAGAGAFARPAVESCPSGATR